MVGKGFTGFGDWSKLGMMGRGLLLVISGFWLEFREGFVVY